MAEKTISGGKRVSPPWEEVLNQPQQGSSGGGSGQARHTPADREDAPKGDPAEEEEPEGAASGTLRGRMRPWQQTTDETFGPPTLAALGGDDLRDDGPRGARRRSLRSEEGGVDGVRRTRRLSFKNDVGEGAPPIGTRRLSFQSDVGDGEVPNRTRRLSLKSDVRDGPSPIGTRRFSFQRDVGDGATTIGTRRLSFQSDVGDEGSPIGTRRLSFSKRGEGALANGVTRPTRERRRSSLDDTRSTASMDELIQVMHTAVSPCLINTPSPHTHESYDASPPARTSHTPPRTESTRPPPHTQTTTPHHTSYPTRPHTSNDPTVTPPDTTS
jgi:hypothetical protein